MTHPLDVADLRPRVQACLDGELVTQRTVLAELGPDVLELVDAIARLLAGGKRLRAAFLHWGLRGANPDLGAGAGAVRLASSMEMFQVAALIHDDVMDDSDTRRGQPAAHRAMARQHVARGWLGDADRFGAAGAILAGNLCLTWADEMYATSGLPPEALARGRATFDRMRTQLMAGQFLDVVESVRPWDDISTNERAARAHHVIRYKSAKYSIEHPLVIGARVGGAAEATVSALGAYGLDLGHAFQLRDDVLGVFGDPAITGKPAGDDLREGKRTVLVARTLELAGATEAAALVGALGTELDEEGVERVRELMAGSGALAAVEAEIARLAGSARAHLAAADIDAQARGVLGDLIDVTTARSS